MGPGGLIHESSEIAESLPVQRPTPSVQPHPHLRGLSTHFYLSALMNQTFYTEAKVYCLVRQLQQ